MVATFINQIKLLQRRTYKQVWELSTLRMPQTVFSSHPGLIGLSVDLDVVIAKVSGLIGNAGLF
ncbi:MAG: hypothetical protein ACO398_11305 [Kiritimatiellia bacterium]